VEHRGHRRGKETLASLHSVCSNAEGFREREGVSEDRLRSFLKKIHPGLFPLGKAGRGTANSDSKRVGQRKI